MGRRVARADVEVTPEVQEQGRSKAASSRSVSRSSGGCKDPSPERPHKRAKSRDKEKESQKSEKKGKVKAKGDGVDDEVKDKDITREKEKERERRKPKRSRSSSSNSAQENVRVSKRRRTKTKHSDSEAKRESQKKCGKRNPRITAKERVRERDKPSGKETMKAKQKEKEREEEKEKDKDDKEKERDKDKDKDRDRDRERDKNKNKEKDKDRDKNKHKDKDKDKSRIKPRRKRRQSRKKRSESRSGPSMSFSRSRRSRRSRSQSRSKSRSQSRSSRSRSLSSRSRSRSLKGKRRKRTGKPSRKRRSTPKRKASKTKRGKDRRRRSKSGRRDREREEKRRAQEMAWTHMQWARMSMGWMPGPYDMGMPMGMMPMHYAPPLGVPVVNPGLMPRSVSSSSSASGSKLSSQRKQGADCQPACDATNSNCDRRENRTDNQDTAEESDAKLTEPPEMAQPVGIVDDNECGCDVEVDGAEGVESDSDSSSSSSSTSASVADVLASVPTQPALQATDGAAAAEALIANQVGTETSIVLSLMPTTDSLLSTSCTRPVTAPIPDVPVPERRRRTFDDVPVVAPTQGAVCPTLPIPGSELFTPYTTPYGSASGGQAATPVLPASLVSSVALEVEAFLQVNVVDPDAGMRLRQLPTHVQQRILERGDLSHARNPSAVLIARMRDAEKGILPHDGLGQPAPPPIGDCHAGVEFLISRFGLDARAAGMLRSLPRHKQDLAAQLDLSDARRPSAFIMSQLSSSKFVDGALLSGVLGSQV